MSENILEIRHLGKSFGTHEVLRDIDFTVKKGDVIMIIESMKLMNEVQSDFDGVVEKILVSDGQAVEYDQPVMIIK